MIAQDITLLSLYHPVQNDIYKNIKLAHSKKAYQGCLGMVTAMAPPENWAGRAHVALWLAGRGLKGQIPEAKITENNKFPFVVSTPFNLAKAEE